MKLSVIVPVYKAENTLRECVDSLLKQGLDDYEVILVNDGSPDRCQEIIDEYAARYPEVVRTILLDNGGQGRARNRGIDIARGDWLAFLDSDDWIEPLTYKRMLEMGEQEGADMVICDDLRFFPDGSTEIFCSWKEGNLIGSAGSVCDKLVRREVVGEIRFPEGLWYEDFAFSLMILQRSGKIIHLPEALYHYRTGLPSTMNNNNSKKNLDIMYIMEIIRPFMEREGYDREDFRYLLINHVLLDAINRLSQQRSQEKQEAVRTLREYVHREIPRLDDSASFRNTAPRRRLIMRLNYLGLENVSRFLLDLNKKLKS